MSECPNCQHLPHPDRRCIGFANCECDLRASFGGAAVRDLEEGRRRRDAGMAQADRHSHPAWKAIAWATLIKMAQSGRDFTAEDVTAVAGMPIGNHNAVGSLFNTAAKRKIIEAVGFQQASRPDRKANTMKVWRGTAKAAVVAVAEPEIPEPTGQMGLLEPAWHCTVCDTELAPGVVNVHAISPLYGEAWCPRCLTKRQVQFR